MNNLYIRIQESVHLINSFFSGRFDDTNFEDLILLKELSKKGVELEKLRSDYNNIYFELKPQLEKFEKGLLKMRFKDVIYEFRSLTLFLIKLMEDIDFEYKGVNLKDDLSLLKSILFHYYKTEPFFNDKPLIEKGKFNLSKEGEDKEPKSEKPYTYFQSLLIFELCIKHKLFDENWKNDNNYNHPISIIMCLGDPKDLNRRIKQLKNLHNGNFTEGQIAYYTKSLNELYNKVVKVSNKDKRFLPLTKDLEFFLSKLNK